MSEKFEFEGEFYELDWGLNHVNKKTLKCDYWDYGDYIKLQYPKKKWFFAKGGSYEGEWAALGVGNGFWFHKGSYGSCSGCDWLEGLSDKEGAIEFLKEMKKIIKIGTTWKKAKEYLQKEKTYSGWDDINEAIDEVIKQYEKSLKDKGKKKNEKR